jgi:hypothetical protein
MATMSADQVLLMVESLVRLSRGMVGAIERHDVAGIEEFAADRQKILDRLAAEGFAGAMPLRADIRRQLLEDDAAITNGVAALKRTALQRIEELNQRRKLASYRDKVRQ